MRLADILSRNALRLILVGFVLVPVAIAASLTVVDLPAQFAPLLLIAWGICAGALAFRLVNQLAALYVSDDVVPGQELRSVSGGQMLSDKPHAVWVPFLITSSWMLIFIGLIWLAFIDLRLTGIVIALFVALCFWWRRGRPSPENHRPPGS